MRSIANLVVGLLAAGMGTALAQAPDAPSNMTPDQAVSPTSLVEGAGVKVGEGTVLHPIVGLETGVVQNVFYEESGTNTSGLLRLLIELQAGSLPQERLSVADREGQAQENLGTLQFDFRTYLSWDQYLSSNDAVMKQGGLGGGLLFRGIVRPSAPLSFSFMENFNRVIRATNFESNDRVNRDINQLQLRLNYRPRGRSLGGYLYFNNTIDVFEDSDQRFLNRLQNTLGLHVNYQWLPLTRLFVDVSQGLFGGLGSASTKVGSLPLTTVAGIMTALTLRTTFSARIGYTNGFYEAGPSYSAVAGGVQLGYRYSPLGRVTALYSYDHADSINANFFRDHKIGLMLEQQALPFTLVLRPEIFFRKYSGVIVMSPDGSTTRNDFIASITAGARYNYRNWLGFTVDYSFAAIQSDFRYVINGSGDLDDPSFSRHTLLAGMRAAY